MGKHGEIKRPSSAERGFMNAVDSFRKQLAGVNASNGVLVIELRADMNIKRFAERVKGGWRNRPWIADVILVKDMGRKSKSIRLTHSSVDWVSVIDQIQKALQ